MKYPNITKRSTGKKMMTVKMDFYLSKEDMSTILGAIINDMIPCNLHATVERDEFENYLDDYIIGLVSKKDIYEKMKFVLYDKGTSFFECSIDNWYVYPEKLLKYCRERINNYFDFS